MGYEREVPNMLALLVEAADAGGGGGCALATALTVCVGAVWLKDVFVKGVGD